MSNKRKNKVDGRRAASFLCLHFYFAHLIEKGERKREGWVSDFEVTRGCVV